jgi:2-amino-4-hydroxy-6-hydroxymethyldihydropteridine diphosphokinase
MSTLAMIGLGSNLGERKALLDAAVAALSAMQGIVVRAVSSYHETKPIGGPSGQGAFLNGAAALDTTLEPIELLRALKLIEAEAGRLRAQRWDERTLDLDLLLYGDQKIDTGPVFNRVFGGETVELRVPHPLFALRRFVLAPLVEIAPEVVDPITGRTVASLLANLDRRPSYVAFAGAHEDGVRTYLFERLVAMLEATAVFDLGSSVESAGQKIFHEWDPHTVLERRVESIRRDRWSALGERWLVSDFAFQETALAAQACWIESDKNTLDQFLSRFQEREREVVPPTFIVELETRPLTLISKPPARKEFDPVSPAPSYTAHSWGGVPALRYDLPDFRMSDDDVHCRILDIPNEIAAICAGTRTG